MTRRVRLEYLVYSTKMYVRLIIDMKIMIARPI